GARRSGLAEDGRRGQKLLDGGAGTLYRSRIYQVVTPLRYLPRFAGDQRQLPQGEPPLQYSGVRLQAIPGLSAPAGLSRDPQTVAIAGQINRHVSSQPICACVG